MEPQQEEGASSSRRVRYWHNAIERDLHKRTLNDSLNKDYYDDKASASLARLVKDFVSSNPWKELPHYERRMTELVQKKRADPSWINPQSFNLGELRLPSINNLIRNGCQYCIEPMDGRERNRLNPIYERILRVMIQGTAPHRLEVWEVIRDLYAMFGPAGRRLIKLVLMRGVDPDRVEAKGNATVLQVMLSNINRRMEKSEMFLIYGSNVDAIADALAEHRRLFLTMLRFGANPLTKSNKPPNSTLLELAVQSGDVGLARTLLHDYGAAPLMTSPERERTSWRNRMSNAFKILCDSPELGGPDGSDVLGMFDLLQGEHLEPLTRETLRDTRRLIGRFQAVRENGNVQPNILARSLNSAVHYWESPAHRQQHKNQERDRVLERLVVAEKERIMLPRKYNDDFQDEIEDLLTNINRAKDSRATLEEVEITRMHIAEKLEYLRAALTAFPFYATTYTNLLLDKNVAVLLRRKSFVLLSDRALNAKHHIFAHQLGGAECLIHILEDVEYWTGRRMAADGVTVISETFDEDALGLLRVVVETSDPYVLETMVSVNADRLTSQTTSIKVSDFQKKKVRHVPVFWLLGLPSQNAAVPGPILEILELVLQRGVDPDCRDSRNRTLMQFILSVEHPTDRAVAERYIQSALPVIELLLRYGARNAYGFQGMQRCLEQAILADKIELVRLMLRYGHCSPDFMVALHRDRLPLSLVSKAMRAASNDGVVAPRTKELALFLLSVTGRLGTFRDSAVIDAVMDIETGEFLMEAPELVRSFPDRHPERPPVKATRQLQGIDPRLIDVDETLRFATDGRGLYSLVTVLADMGIVGDETQQAYFLSDTGGSVTRPLRYKTVKPILDNISVIMSKVRAYGGREARWAIHLHFIEYATPKAMRYATEKVPLPDPNVRIYTAIFREVGLRLARGTDDITENHGQALAQKYRRTFVRNLAIFLQAVLTMEQVPPDWKIDIWLVALSGFGINGGLTLDVLKEYAKLGDSSNQSVQLIEQCILTQTQVLNGSDKRISILMLLLDAGAVTERQLLDVVEPLMDQGVILGFNDRFSDPIKISCDPSDQQQQQPETVARMQEPLEMFWRQQMALGMQIAQTRHDNPGSLISAQTLMMMTNRLRYPDLPIVYFAQDSEVDASSRLGMPVMRIRGTPVRQAGDVVATLRMQSRRPVELFWIKFGLLDLASLFKKYRINVEPREPGNRSLWDLRPPNTRAMLNTLASLGANISNSQLYQEFSRFRSTSRSRTRQTIDQLRQDLARVTDMLQTNRDDNGNAIDAALRRRLEADRSQFTRSLKHNEDLLSGGSDQDYFVNIGLAFRYLWPDQEDLVYGVQMTLSELVQKAEQQEQEALQLQAMRQAREEEQDRRPAPWDDGDDMTLSMSRIMFGKAK